MAAPSTKNIKSLEGKWIMDKSHSDPLDPALSLQGIGWLIRRTLSLATVTQYLTSTLSPQGVRHITIEQFATGGLKGTTENRILDWTYRPHSDWLFGDLKGKSRFSSLNTIKEEAKGSGNVEKDCEWIAEGWLEESKGEDAVIESYVENEVGGWTARQVWGFGEVEGERWFVRRIVVRRGEEVARIRLSYSWAGELDE